MVIHCILDFKISGNLYKREVFNLILNSGVSFLLKEKVKGCILFVDDEELVLLAGSNLLRSMSYNVISASDGFEALEIFKRDQDRICLAIIDLLMPGMNGIELFHKLKEINPGLDIVLCSGLFGEETEDELLSSGAAGIIMKPYTLNELKSVLEKFDLTDAF